VLTRQASSASKAAVAEKSGVYGRARGLARSFGQQRRTPLSAHPRRGPPGRDDADCQGWNAVPTTRLRIVAGRGLDARRVVTLSLPSPPIIQDDIMVP